MKHYTVKMYAYLTIVVLLLVFVGCASVDTAKPKEATDTAQTQKSATEPQTDDYLGEGVVLAAFYEEDGGFSLTRYYPADVLTPGSDETNGEYQVVSLIGDFDVAKGSENWTDDVILDSHPAHKSELEAGMVVLYTKKEVKEGLERARWNKGIVSSTEELYKDTVTIDSVYHRDRDDEGDRQYDIAVEKIRIIDKWTRE